MLGDFKQKGIIDEAKLNPLDELIRLSYADQFRILNTPWLSLDEQRSLFGAIRNVHTTAKTLKARLAAASERHENPTMADLSFEVTESLSNLAPYIDECFTRGQVSQISSINELSRILYKKAKRFGFLEDSATQFKTLEIGPEELKSFTDRLNQNIQSETDIDEDVGSTNEDCH